MKGCVQSVHLEYTVIKCASITVNKDVIRILVSVLTVLTRDMENCVTRLVVLVVTRDVTDTMAAVRANQAGKARLVVVTLLLSSIQPCI